MERFERLARRAAILFTLLGLAAAGGCSGIPGYPPSLLPWLHPVLLLLGAAAGWAAVVRGVEIDRKRWEIVEEPLLTSGERQYAHKDAERRRRVAAVSFLGAPLMLGFWLTYQVDESGRGVLAGLLLVTVIAGFLAGMLLTTWRQAKLDGRG